ncbi:MAG: aryl-sulfate sulfotransferase [Candidatus Heimdallarchaeota archaeon]|nr:aryl-sulfate sulfotransferase [Candidatus Heimdallarchaeota archaeon]
MSLDTDFEAERVMIWNTETDEIVSFDFVTNQHHDVRYNSETNTILVLEFYLDEIINATGMLETMLVDRLVEYDLTGNVVWEFYLVDHTDFASYYEILNRTSRGRDNWIFNQTSYPDPTHTSSIFWDTDEDVIYINVRHFNQFWKVDHKTGGVVWKAGEAGNFTLIDDQGNEKNTLWYNSHDLTSLGDNEFLMFDNDFRNESVFSAEDHKSSILRIKINEETNEVVEVFRWVAPTAYYGFFWGGAQLLQNGNYLGSFGSLIHGPRGNEIHDDFGGAAIEVTPEGEIVWEMRLPYNWGFYRMRRIIPELNILSAELTAREDGISVVVDSYSNFPQKYVFNLDGSFIEYKLWNGRSISEIFDRSMFRADLTTHEIEIIVFDAAGNSQRSTFMIDFEVSKPLMSSQSTESDSPMILPVTSSLTLSLYTMHLRKRNRSDKSLE